MAAELVRRNLGLVYGGGNAGLMGELADAILRTDGEVQGVIPENLMGAGGRAQGSYKTPCRAFHARAQDPDGRSVGWVRCDAGRFGTLEEFYEVLTWTQLGPQNPQHDFGRRGGSIHVLHDPAVPFRKEPEIWNRRNGLNLVQGASWVAGHRNGQKIWQKTRGQ
jgi:hypothetical protein